MLQELLQQWPPWWPPLMLLGLLSSGLLAWPVATVLDVRLWVAFGLLASLAFVMVVTLTADRSVALSSCIWGAVPPVSPLDIRPGSSRWLNTVLFVPLGFFAGLVAVRHWWIAALALAVSPFVELIQRHWDAIHRTCQIQDLVDNTWGLVCGLLIGVLTGLLFSRSVVADRAHGRA